MSDADPPGPVGLLDAVAHWAATTPDAMALQFLEDGDTVGRTLTYAALWTEIDRRAAALLEHVSPGDRVGLCLASEFDTLVHLLACLRAGLVAVPSLSASNDRAIRRIEGHLEDSGASLVLVDEMFEARLRLRPGSGTLASLPRRRVDGLATPGDGMRRLDACPADDRLAYLQYTSGSTMAPRGVMISHANLAAQVAMLHRRLEVSPGEVVVNWMPLHHDFGLVMSSTALHAGACCVLIPPLRVVQQPIRWLRAVHRFRARTTASATSMLDICAQKVKPVALAGLDLSGLGCLVVGAEPIQTGIVDAFCRLLAPAGMRASAVLPAYGMAEATLCLTTAFPGQPVRRCFDEQQLSVGRAVEQEQGRELISSGSACFPDSLHVVDPNSLRLCGEGTVGELWVRGPSIGQGYWNQPELTRAQFRAGHPAVAGGGLLRTGDLAFVHEGNVYITGRSKDLVIVNGVNHYPQDIEWTVTQAHPDLEAGACAAFAVERDGLERLVVAAEVRRTARRSLDIAEVIARVRPAVVRDHEIDLEALVLLTPAGMPRTSSGKIQRQLCRRLHLEGRLPVQHAWHREGSAGTAASAAVAEPSAAGPATAPAPPPVAETEAQVLALCRDVLQSPHMGLGDDVLAHGADSLKMTELLTEVEARWNRQIDVLRFNADPTPRELVAQLIGASARPAPAAPGVPQEEGVLLQRLSSAHEHALSTYTAAWQADWVSPNRLLFGLNLCGRQPPLFWCFQGHREFTQMARHLGADQPLYGMRSGHLVFDHTDSAAVTGLAVRYAEEILRFAPQAAYRLGGNCQAGLVMNRLARLLLATGRVVDGLFLLENIVPRVDPSPMPCPVALFYGEQSTLFNPLLQFHSPESSWDKLYPLGYSMDAVWGGHGQYFDEPNVADFCAKLERRLAQASEPRRPRALPVEAMRAQLEAEAPEQMIAGAFCWLPVKVTNRSSHAWRSGPSSGLVVANHWLDAAATPVAWRDGYAPVPRDLPPGESLSVRVPVRAPRAEGEFILELDVAEQGVAWMSQRGGATWRCSVRVRRG
jgi:acyl-CoA synthetase (AMP-forming)/AMP-acid ligase II